MQNNISSPHKLVQCSRLQAVTSRNNHKSLSSNPDNLSNAAVFISILQSKTHKTPRINKIHHQTSRRITKVIITVNLHFRRKLF